MAIDYAVLKAECANNQNGYSYTDVPSQTTLTLAQWYAAGADAVCAIILNAARNAIDIARSNVAPQEVIEAIAIGDLKAATTTIQGSWFESFTQLASVQLMKQNGNNTRVMDNLLLILQNGSSSETRLKALATRKGSRAEQLFGEGTTLTANDIIQARAA